MCGHGKHPQSAGGSPSSFSGASFFDLRREADAFAALSRISMEVKGSAIMYRHHFTAGLALLAALAAQPAFAQHGQSQMESRVAPLGQSDRPSQSQHNYLWAPSQSDTPSAWQTQPPYYQQPYYQQPYYQQPYYTSPSWTYTQPYTSGYRPRVAPDTSSDIYYPPQYHLGVTYQTTPYGAQVTYVYPGSAAARIGLEVGDTILSIDNVPVTYNNSLGRAIAYSDGFVRLRIRDVRTGRVVERNADLSR
jgi:hypothetical protein